MTSMGCPAPQSKRGDTSGKPPRGGLGAAAGLSVERAADEPAAPETIVFGGDELDVGPGATRRGGAHRN